MRERRGRGKVRAILSTDARGYSVWPLKGRALRLSLIPGTAILWFRLYNVCNARRSIATDENIAMRITIRYQVRDESTSRQLELTPDEYFDPPDPGERLNVRSVARRMETHHYTSFSAKELAWTLLEITEGTDFWRVRTQFLDGQRSCMQHTQQSDGSEEIIHQSRLSEHCWHTVRVLKESGKLWATTCDSLIVEQATTLTSHKDIAERTSFADRIAFGNV